MTRISGGEILVRALVAAGVETLFGINGAHVDGIYQAALDHGLPIVDTRHEMNAGHAAEGYARVRNSLGVAVLTAGGGFTNGLTSMANAYLDRTPVLYLAGSGPLRDDQTNTLQAGIDQVAMATPVTKWAHRVTRTDLIGRLLARAIRTALAGPRGPVLLDVPWDVLAGEAEVADSGKTPAGPGVRAAAADPEAVSAICGILLQARRPVILAGSEVVRAGASSALRRFAQEADIPLLADYEALGALTGSPLNFGLIQSLFGLDEDAAPDAVLMLGLRFGLTTVHGSGKLIPRNARIIHADPAAAELGSLQEVEIPVVADPQPLLEQLSQILAARGGAGRQDRSLWKKQLRAHIERRAATVAAQVKQDARVHPYDAVRTIAECVPEGAVVVADGALTYLWLSETIPNAPVSSYLCHGYLGSMGVGMGVAIGAQAAARGTSVILVTGDGAVGYSLGEFDTMVRAGLSVVVIVLNNRAWGATLHAQELSLGRSRIVSNRLENGDYSAVAKGLGADGYSVAHIADLAPAIREALAGRRPACIDVQVSLDPIPPEERVIMGGSPF
jgi:acetolactate synthase-1/2/3 large subunit